MNEAADVNSPAPAPSAPPAHATSYPRFLWRAIGVATDGNLAFYAWMTFLTAVALVGANAWAHQVANGMDVTGMTDQVSWGLYIANFTFAVGLAAGGVTMVIPAYLYRDKAMHDVVIVGEILAIAALVTALAFVTVDLGRPDRFWHLIPGIGRFNFPSSMLTWDVIALSGYLLLNLHIAGYMLYVRFRGEAPARRWYVPFVMLSIVWAVSIHTVTAFLYSGLGGRPFWNSALLAPRFIASAFITGPAFVIVSLQLLARFTTFEISGKALKTLLRIMQVTVLLNLFMLISEVFTEFYTGGAHTDAARYLFFGLHGHTGLVPWIWTGIGLNVVAAAILLSANPRTHGALITLACFMTFAGVWIEKGMGLIVPGFIPSTLHEIVEYSPSLVEWKVTAGIWALGLIIFTIGLKLAAAVFTGEMRLHGQPAATQGDR
jgi:Ni/Fe-hydrogenase subunit HybB-like protein